MGGRTQAAGLQAGTRRCHVQAGTCTSAIAAADPRPAPSGGHLRGAVRQVRPAEVLDEQRQAARVQAVQGLPGAEGQAGHEVLPEGGARAGPPAEGPQAQAPSRRHAM